MKKVKLKEARGITLVALVITVIILLILAGVALSLVIGENGLIAKTKTAKEVTDKAQVIEDTTLQNYANFISEELELENMQEEVYNIIALLGNCKASIENATTIKANQELTLKFEANVVSSSDTVNWSVNCEGATITIDDETGHSLQVTIRNAVSNVKLNVAATVYSCCFVAGTQVWMADGETKNIEDIEVGDVVLSYNETSNEYENCTVTGLITNPNTTNLARITLVDGTIIEMNEYHPIYTQDGWKSLTNHEGLPTLTKNDKVFSVNGKFINISSIDCWKEEPPITTYNLSVENNHNYFVGETAVLVHNAPCAN